MERAAFLLTNGTRVSCLLNPESIVEFRDAGLTPRALHGRLEPLASNADAPMIAAGSGKSLLELELLFDLSVAGSSHRPKDVRVLTSPLREMATRPRPRQRQGSVVHRVTFVWGKSWNVTGVVTELAERLEVFDREGRPGRSWLKLRLRRIGLEPDPTVPSPSLVVPDASLLSRTRRPGPRRRSRAAHTWRGSRPGAGVDRLDLLASEFFGRADAWRAIAAANGIEDPFHVTGGTVIQIPDTMDRTTDQPPAGGLQAPTAPEADPAGEISLCSGVEA